MNHAIRAMVLIAVITPALFHNAAAPAADRRSDFVLGTLKRYAPQGYHVVSSVMEVTKGCGGIMVLKDKPLSFMNFIKANDEPGMVMKLRDVVHEQNHMYTQVMARCLSDEALKEPGSTFYSFYVDTETIVVRLTETFPSREIASGVPAQFRGDRFQHYIETAGANNITQKRGIYGLLNEFNSYYQGTRAAVDLLEWYKYEKNQTADAWGDFFMNPRLTYMAHMEFKLYIYRYLLHAKKKYPSIYRDIMANAPFRKAFAAIDRNWKSLMIEMFDAGRNIARVKYGGAFTVEVKPLAGPGSTYLKLTRDGKSQWICFALMESEYRNYEKEMGKPEYREIAADLAAGTK